MRFGTRIALAAIALTLPVAAIAATAGNWHRVGGNDSSVTYIDKASIRTVGAERHAWAWSLFAKPIEGRVYSGKINYAFDCAAGTYRSLGYIHIGANGEELSNHNSTTSDQRRTPPPGSISETMVKFVCTGQGGVAVADPNADSDTILVR